MSTLDRKEPVTRIPSYLILFLNKIYHNSSTQRRRYWGITTVSFAPIWRDAICIRTRAMLRDAGHDVCTVNRLAQLYSEQLQEEYSRYDSKSELLIVLCILWGLPSLGSFKSQKMSKKLRTCPLSARVLTTSCPDHVKTETVCATRRLQRQVIFQPQLFRWLVISAIARIYLVIR